MKFQFLSHICLHPFWMSELIIIQEELIPYQKFSTTIVSKEFNLIFCFLQNLAIHNLAGLYFSSIIRYYILF